MLSLSDNAFVIHDDKRVVGQRRHSPICRSLKATCHGDPPISMLTPNVDMRSRHGLKHTITHHTIVVYSGLSTSSWCRSNFDSLSRCAFVVAVALSGRSCYRRGGPIIFVARAPVVATAANQNLTLVRGCSSREPKLDGPG